MEARSQALRRDGGNPFMDLFLPRAVIALKQGAGRLIRDVEDRGVLVLCDPRLRTRGYGEVFLDSLPPMRRTDDVVEARAFFRP
jgi:ATP-dependent DNA helicase DinG